MAAPSRHTKPNSPLTKNTASSAVHHRILTSLPSHRLVRRPDVPDSRNSTTKEKSSLDITQRLEEKLAECNASKNIFLRWLFEIASWVASALCMGGVIGIHIRINQTPMGENEILLTLANKLGKVTSAALIIPTSEALGQLKWH